jgi:hypothetical protein
VFEIAWTKAGDFKTVAFEPGEWEDALREEGEANYFCNRSLLEARKLRIENSI